MELDTLRARLGYLHDETGVVWRKIAEMPEFNGVSFGVLNGVYHGKEPTDNEIRLKLGLPTIEFVRQDRGRNGRFYRRT